MLSLLSSGSGARHSSLINPVFVSFEILAQVMLLVTPLVLRTGAQRNYSSLCLMGSLKEIGSSGKEVLKGAFFPFTNNGICCIWPFKSVGYRMMVLGAG